MVVPVLAGAALGAGLGAAVGNLTIAAGGAGSGGERYIREYLKRGQAVHPADLIERQFPAPRLDRVAEFTPELYDPQFVTDPELVGGDQARELDQIEALQQLQRMGREGLPIEDLLAARNIQRGFAGETERARDATLRRFQAQGRASGGDQLAAEMLGQQRAANQLRDQGQDLLRLQAQRRMSAQLAASQIAGGMRDQSVAQETYNKSTVNMFNDEAKRRMQQVARDNAATLTQSQFLNAGEAQRLADHNAMQRSATLRENVYGPNEVRQQEFNNALAYQRMLGKALSARADQANAQQTARANAIKGIAGGIGQVAGAGIGSLFAESGAQPATAASDAAAIPERRSSTYSSVMGPGGGQDPFEGEDYKLRLFY